MRMLPTSMAINAMLPLAEYFAKKKGIRILQGGNQFAAFRNNVITLPIIPPGLENKFVNGLLGGILHEGSHLAMSDYGALDKSKTDPKYALTNLLEDIRIEYHAARKYPGGKQILLRFDNYIKTYFRMRKQKRQELEDAGEEVPSSLKEDPWKLLGIVMLDNMLGYPPGIDIYDIRHKWVVDQCMDLLNKIPTFDEGLQGSWQCLDLSVEMYKRISQLLPKSQGKGDSENELSIPSSALDDEDAETDKNGETQKQSPKGKKKKNAKSKKRDKTDNDDEEDFGDEKDYFTDGGNEYPQEIFDSEGLDDEEMGEDEQGKDEKNAGKEREEREGEESEEERSSERDTELGGEDGDGKEELEKADSDEITDKIIDDDPNKRDPDASRDDDDVPKGGDQIFDPEMWDRLSNELNVSPNLDRTDILNDIFDETLREMGEGGKHLPYPDVLPRDVIIHDKASRVDLQFGNAYTQIVNQVSPQISVAMGRLIPLLMSFKQRSWRVNLESGEDINEACLALIKHGEERIYKDRSPKQIINTAITFLLDVSGSMSGDKIAQERRAMIAWAETLETIHIPYEILAFTTLGDYYSESLREKAQREGTTQIYNRFEAVKHIVIKSFEETLNDARWRLMTMRSGNCNCDPEALWWAASRILPRPERRKIIFLCHDGFPNLGQGSSHAKLNDELTFAIKTLNLHGLETYGVGILTDVPEKFYPPGKFTAIRGDKQIALSLFDLLERKLREISSDY